MRILLLPLILFSQMVFAQPNSESPQTSSNKQVKKCQMQTVKEESFLSRCPKGWVMTEARSIEGSIFLSIVCAEIEFVCE